MFKLPKFGKRSQQSGLFEDSLTGEPAGLAAEEAPPAPRKSKPAKARKPMAPRTKRADYEVITQASQLRDVTHRKVLVCGHALFATLDTKRDAPSAGFILQAPRQTAPAMRAILGRKGGDLRVAVDARLLEKARTRYALALDGYLAWGKRNGAGNTILFGGGEDTGMTYLEIYVFRDRVLVEYMERELPNAGDSVFPVTVTHLLEELGSRYPNPRVVAAAPLPEWGIAGVEYLGDKPLRGLSFMPLSAKPKSATGMRPFVVVTGTGAVVYACLLAGGWHLYDKAGKVYQVEANDPELTATGGINNARLDMMQQQRLFMEAERPQTALAKNSTRVVAGIASISDVRIKDLTFHTKKPVGEAVDPAAVAGDGSVAADGPMPDVTMEIVVPSTDSAAVDQAKVLMNVMSARTGLDLRLTPGGWNTDSEAATRTFRIEGFLK